MPALANLQRQLSRAFVGWTAVMALLLLAAFAAKVSSHFSRVWTILWYVSALGGFVVIRIVVHEIIRRWTESGRLVREVAVYGAGAQGRRMIEFLQRPGSGFRVVGVFDDREDAVSRLGGTLTARTAAISKRCWNSPAAVRSTRSSSPCRGPASTASPGS